MSSDQAAADAPGPEHAAFVRLPAGAAFDGRDGVMSRAARELRTRGTAHCAVHGHPGFVPDDYLAGLGPQTAITAAELCTAGLWQRVPCGCRVPGGEAIQVCIDRMRELRKTPSRAREREREDEHDARLAHAVLAARHARCCGTPSARIELVAPGGSPARREQRPGTFSRSPDRTRGAWAGGR